MGHEQNEKTPLNRRDFFKAAGAGVAAATVLMTPRDAAAAQAAAEKNALERIASNSYPIRPLFKTRGNPGGGGGRAGAGAAVPGDSTGSPAVAGRGGAQPPGGGGGAATVAPPGGAGRGAGAPDQPPLDQNPNAAKPLAVAAAATAARANLLNTQQMKEKYGEITMLDFPQFTKDTFPGVTHMDIFSALFGDVTDDIMFMPAERRPGGFDPMSPSGRKWLDTLAEHAGEDRHQGAAHLEQRADQPRVGPGRGRLRKAGVDDGQAVARGLRGARREVDAHELAAGARAEHPAERDSAIGGDGYPRNLDIVPLLERGDRVVQGDGRLRRQSRHQGHVRESLGPGRRSDEHPDHHRRRSIIRIAKRRRTSATGSTSTCCSTASRRWRRTRTPTSTRSTGIAGATRTTCSGRRAIMLAGGFKGTFALEYEAGPLNGVEGAKYLYKEVLAALTTPTPVVGA